MWYGSPQWQIDALWRFQIPEEMRKKYGYPELTQSAKRKILGLNSAGLYGMQGVGSGNLETRFKPVPKDYGQRMPKDLKTIMEMPGFTADNMTRFQETRASGGEPGNLGTDGFARPSRCRWPRPSKPAGRIDIGARNYLFLLCFE